jgi:hypothetical protein
MRSKKEEQTFEQISKLNGQERIDALVDLLYSDGRSQLTRDQYYELAWPDRRVIDDLCTAADSNEGALTGRAESFETRWKCSILGGSHVQGESGLGRLVLSFETKDRNERSMYLVVESDFWGEFLVFNGPYSNDEDLLVNYKTNAETIFEGSDHVRLAWTSNWETIDSDEPPYSTKTKPPKRKLLVRQLTKEDLIGRNSFAIGESRSTPLLSEEFPGKKLLDLLSQPPIAAPTQKAEFDDTKERPRKEISSDKVDPGSES